MVILTTWLLKSSHNKINNRDAEAESFTLACFSCNNHVHMSFKVYKTLTLNNGWFAEVISD